MIQKHILLSLLIGFLFFTNSLAQNCGLKNPSFEYYTSCPTGFSQYDEVENWINILPDLTSEPDYFNESCPNGLFGGYNYSGYSDVDGTVRNNNSQHLCGRIGMYLNKDTGSDTRIKEYITQRVDLTAGVTYKIKIQVEKSSFITSSILQRDLTFFGYNGTIPTTHVNLCPVGIDSLAAVPRASITVNNQTHTVTFTPSQNYDYLVIGANCNGILYATETGYIFIDKVELSSTSNNSSFTPVINHISNDIGYIPPSLYDNNNSSDCKNCFSDYRNKMRLEGNTIPTGVTATWGQKSTNPETVTFTNPTDSSTGVSGNTLLTPGFYTFYYTFTNGTCSLIDSLEIEVKSLLAFSAGPDVLNCGGNNDASSSNNGIIVYDSKLANPLAPDASSNIVIFIGATIPANFKTLYWSMIQKDGTEHIFPATNYSNVPLLDSGYCQGRVYKSGSSNSSPRFNFTNPQDSVTFILNIIDECQTLLKDTMLYVVSDVNLRFDKPTYCIGETALINQIPTTIICSIDSLTLQKKSNLSFTWDIDDPGLIPSNISVSDSLQLLISATTIPGWHTIKLTVFDSLTNCSFYDEHEFYVKDSLEEFSAGKDYIFCEGNNDNLFDTSYTNPSAPTSNTRAVVMNALPVIDTLNNNDYTTYWSMIVNDSTEWTFVNPCGIPFDGPDQGDVFTLDFTTDTLDCGDIMENTAEQFWSHSPTARFYVRNARDTIQFVFHLLDICGTDTTEYKDTMVVYMNDVDLIAGLTSYCITDTGFTTQLNNPNFRKVLPDSNLIYSWTSPPDVILLDSTVKDSIYFYFDSNSSRGQKIIRLTITDTSTGCSWYDETRVNIRVELDSVNAGDDIILCNSNFVNQGINMNAYPNNGIIGSNSYSSYWSVLQTGAPDYVFYNPYGIPYNGTGLDEGLLFSYNNYSYSANALFIFRAYGERTLVWHVIDKCDTTIHLTDTVTVKWDFNEPFISAGPDQNPKCDGAFLTGNPSASSSGTSGCFNWKQVSGPDTLDLLDSTKRIAQLINLDSALAGTYKFVYTLGCGFCPKFDTMTLTIDSIKDPPFKMVWDTVSKICVEDSLVFTGKGGSSYEWYINDSLIQPFSSDSTFAVANSLDSVKVSVLVKDSVNECISFNQNFFHKFVGVICYADRDTIYTCGDACVSSKDLPYGNHVFKSCGTLTTNIGATFSLLDSCITYNELLAPQTWLYDTLCVELIDTINDIYDTTDIFITNCDSSIFISCKDDTLYLDNLGSLLTIDTSNVLDSMFASTGIDSVYLSRNSFDCNEIGQNPVTVTARNTYHQKTTSCIATVTILDTIKPIVFCHDTTLYLNNNGIVFFDTAAVLTNIIENCTLDSVWMDKDSAICNQDTVAMQLFARDQSGNIGVCSTFIFVLDTISPVVYCHDTILYLNSNGKVFFDTAAVLNSIDENCTIDSVWMDKDSAICTNDTVYTTIFARDNSGNMGQCEAIIIVLDSIKPIVYCHDTTVFLNNQGKVYFDTSTIFTSVTENCTVDSIWINRDSADCSMDSVQITIYARDNSGNIGQCIATAFVKDTTSPIVLCKPATVYILPSGVVGIDSSFLDNGSNDICGIQSITISQDTFDCTHVGANSVTVVVIDNSGNKDSCTATVTVIDTNTYRALAGNDSSYCNVTSVTMNANYVFGRIQGTWTLDPTYSNANIPIITSVNQHNTIITGMIEGEYRFVWNVTNKPCLDLFDTVIIRIFDQPNAILPTDIDICYENSQSILAQPLLGLATGTWTNYFNSVNIPTTNYYNDSANIGNITQGSEYRFYFEATNGVCPASRDSMVINRHYTPSVDFILDTNAICEGGCINFINTSSISPPESITNYSWTVDSFSTTARDFNLCFADKGMKSISLVVTSNWGCVDSINRTNYITVHENPTASFNYLMNSNLNTLYDFTDKSLLAASYLYTFGDGTSSTLQNPSHDYAITQDYLVTQIVTSSFGCKDTISELIQVRNLSIYIPNSFTPNGDGLNDIFLPAVLGEDSTSFELLIFNRWGEVIFTSNSTSLGWDGTHNGELVQSGSYVWKLKARKMSSSDLEEHIGHINLIR